LFCIVFLEENNFTTRGAPPPQSSHTPEITITQQKPAKPLNFISLEHERVASKLITGEFADLLQKDYKGEANLEEQKQIVDEMITLWKQGKHKAKDPQTQQIREIKSEAVLSIFHREQSKKRQFWIKFISLLGGVLVVMWALLYIGFWISDGFSNNDRKPDEQHKDW